VVLFGYVRCTPHDETRDLQTEALMSAGVDPLYIYEDVIPIHQRRRPGFAAVLKALYNGEDTLVIWRLDRLGRDTKHLLQIIEDLKKREIGLKALTGFAIDTSTPHGVMVFTVFAALAQYERNLIRERTLAGLAAARARGRKGGRPPKLSPGQQQLAYQMAAARTIPILHIARTLGCDPKTIRKAIAQVQSPSPPTQAEVAD
jgi:DNA invertase Pin-like site-specific DNA recombinase